MTALALQYRDQFISGLAEGKRLSDIATHLNLAVSRQAISKVLKDDPEYRDAVEAGFEARLDQAEAELEKATDSQVDVARARARFQAVAWRAERECRDRWGQQQQVGIGQVIINLGVSPRNAVPQQAEKVVNNQCPEISISSVNSEE